MRKLIILLTAFVLTGVGITQAQVNGKITGTITDSVSNQPLAFASVSLITPTGKTVNVALTDDDGNFIIESVAPGSYRLPVVFVGYVTKKSGLDRKRIV